jgi:hypothetical protein
MLADVRAALSNDKRTVFLHDDLFCGMDLRQNLIV